MTPVFPREGTAVPFFFVCAGMRRTGGTGVSAHGAETGDAPPIFFLRHQKENAPCTVEKKKCWVQILPFGQVWTCAGGVDVVAVVDGGWYWGALSPWGKEKCFPAIGVWVRLSGWLSDFARSLPRAFRFATNYREVAGRPIRSWQSGSGGKKQVKSGLHPTPHESSPSRAEWPKVSARSGPL